MNLSLLIQKKRRVRVMSEVAWLVHTFNGYRHLWGGCFSNWEVLNIGVPKYFGTDLPIDELEPTLAGFKTIYSGVGEWSDRLRVLVEQIPYDFIGYSQEDHWPVKNPPNLSEMMEIISENDLFRLQLGLVNHFYTLTGGKLPLFFHHTSKYLVSHQPSIWKKSFLLECLKPNENPWNNEYFGTLRLNNDPKIKDKIAIYPCNWYAHMCIKGNIHVNGGN